MKECVSLRTQINRDANAVDTLQEMLARGRKSCASFHSINFPNDRDWIYRQVGRNQLPLRIPNPTSPPYPSGTQRRRIERYPERASSRERALFLAEESHGVILMYYSRKKRVTIVPSHFSRSVFLGARFFNIRISYDMSFPP